MGAGGNRDSKCNMFYKKAVKERGEVGQYLEGVLGTKDDVKMEEMNQKRAV